MTNTIPPEVAGLVPFPLPCRHCKGTGQITAWRCTTCVDRHYFQCLGLEEAEFPPLPPLYTDAQLRRRSDPPTFPHCGHDIVIGHYTLNATLVPCECAKCIGGTYFIYLTPDQAEAKREKKRLKDEDTKKRFHSGAGFRVECGAMTRAGVPCIHRCVAGMSKCHNHGGRSTGPRTAEGRQRVNEGRWGERLKRKSSPTP